MMEWRSKRQLILKLLYRSGFVRLWCLLRRNKVTIITFHGVMDMAVPAEWEPLRPRITRHDFDRALMLLKRYYTFVSMRQALDILRGDEPAIPNPCVVTFDDGHKNNITCALPILRKHRIPVVFYPSTDFVSSGDPFWFDRLDFAIQQEGLHGMTLEVGNERVVIDQANRTSMTQTLALVIKELKHSHVVDSEFRSNIESIIEQLEEHSGRSIRDLKPGDNWSSVMSWEQVIACANSDDIEIGSHTVNHVRLSHVSDEQVKYELVESKRIIEEKTHGTCNLFCFPNGAWSMKAVNLLKEAGYVCAVTSDSGENAPGDNLFLLKRYSVPNRGSALDVLFTICGIFHFKEKLFKRVTSKGG